MAGYSTVSALRLNIICIYNLSMGEKFVKYVCWDLGRLSISAHFDKSRIVKTKKLNRKLSN
jgi:hypothetical protein